MIKNFENFVKEELETPIGRFVYIIYYRYGSAECQQVLGIYGESDYEDAWEREREDFLNMGPDDISLLYLYKLPKSVFMKYKKEIEDMVNSDDPYSFDYDLREYLDDYKIDVCDIDG